MNLEDKYKESLNFETEPPKNDKNKKYIIGAIAVAFVVLIIFLFVNGKNKTTNQQETESEVSIQQDYDSERFMNQTYQEARENAGKTPKPEIMKQTRESLLSDSGIKKQAAWDGEGAAEDGGGVTIDDFADDYKKNLRDYYNENFNLDIKIGSMIPSEAQGYTSDPAKEMENEFLPNINYVPYTNEDIQFLIAYMIEIKCNDILNGTGDKPSEIGWVEVEVDNYSQDNFETIPIIHVKYYDFDKGIGEFSFIIFDKTIEWL